MSKDLKIGLEEAKAKLQTVDSEFVQLLLTNSLEVEYYKPVLVDKQTPHDRDELYVIAAGQSDFVRAGDKVHVKTGDVLFVPAHVEHRFLDFSEDFSTWVIFVN